MLACVVIVYVDLLLLADDCDESEERERERDAEALRVALTLGEDARVLVTCLSRTHSRTMETVRCSPRCTSASSLCALVVHIVTHATQSLALLCDGEARRSNTQMLLHAAVIKDAWRT